jgi:Peptidase family M23/Bacterial Ig-like domain (group 2)
MLPLALTVATWACDEEPAAPRALPAIKITVEPDQLTLPIGASFPLVAMVRDVDGRPLEGRTIGWVSAAPEIASVSSSGVVTAHAVGSATITAHSEPGIGFARVVVQEDFRLPLPAGHWLLRTEVGTPAPECPEQEGGLRRDGERDCSHAGVSRYSIDFAAVTEDEGPLTGLRPVDILAAADGRVSDVCLLLPPLANCGPDGPFVAVEHASGLRTVYAHLDPASVKVRRKSSVSRGQPLGAMGVFGADPEAWVHFELRFQNQGAGAASALEALLVDGLALREYRVGADGSGFYASTNGRGEEPPPGGANAIR